MSDRRLLILSGIPPGPWGTGRLMTFLSAEVARLGGCDVLARPERPGNLRRPTLASLGAAARYALREAAFHVRLTEARRDRARPLLVLHPQTLGFRLTMELIEERSAPLGLYLLDSSFFCIESYNHVPGEWSPCQRCAGGRFEQAAVMGCRPFPKPDPEAAHFVRQLLGYVRSGRVVPIAQTATQAAIAQRHFGLPRTPTVVGLWSADWDDVVLAWRSIPPAGKPKWDVTFHGFDLAAKGAQWLEQVARHLPHRRFLFPFARGTRTRAAQNCEYVPMTWETGLRDAVSSCRIAAVPSLWSAPIEGALLKSIACAPAAAVVDNQSAYSAELPEGLVLRLSPRPEEAAAQLEKALQGERRPLDAMTADWWKALKQQRQEFVRRLLGAVPGWSLDDGSKL